MYAHIEAGSFACPRCGVMHLTDARGALRAPGRRRDAAARGYDPRTARFKCRGCGYSAYLGVVFWPAGKGGVALPADHVLTPGEASELRLELSYQGEVPPEPREGRHWSHTSRIKRTNVECTCGEDCPVHGALGTPRKD